MDYYIDIKIKPDSEMPENVLLNKVFTKLHKALFDRNATDIAVSFPKWKVMLGDLLRIHSSENSLKALQESNWLGGLIGYCDTSEIQRVPIDRKYRLIKRKQTNMSQSKLNRLLKRGSISEEDAKQYRAKMFTKGLDNPFVELVSGSNGHKHRRYIEISDLLDSPVGGEFDQFGLSKTATVPWF